MKLVSTSINNEEIYWILLKSLEIRLRKVFMNDIIRLIGIFSRFRLNNHSPDEST